MGSSTKRGTPLETRGGTEQLSQGLRSVFQGQGGGPANFEQILGRLGGETQQLGAAGAQNFLGFTPGSVGLGQAVAGALQDPSQQAREALMPFFQRQQSEGLANVLSQLGGVGGRFGGSAGDTAGRFAGELAGQQAQQLGNLALQGQQAQNQALATILPALNQSAATNIQGTQNQLGQLMNFFQPGAPVIQQGVGGQLLGLAGTLGGAALGGPIGGALGGKLAGALGGGGGGGLAAPPGPFHQGVPFDFSQLAIG